MDKERLEKVATLLEEAEHSVVLTGAGISTESGIPDYRSQNGMWQKHDATKLGTVEAMEENYPLFHQFYQERLLTLKECQPNRGHRILAKWENEGILQSIITQNVDGLHQKGGNRKVLELHGNIQNIRCHHCGKKAVLKEFLSKQPCQSCGGPLRPGVVLFGEALPQQAWEEAIKETQKTKLLLVIGTSLMVSPVNQIPLFVGPEAKTILINRDPTHLDHSFDFFFHHQAGEVLTAMDAYRKKKNY